MTPTPRTDAEATKGSRTGTRLGPFVHADFARQLETDLLHFKSAYSRALNFVCEQHYPAIPATEHDDPFFKAVDGNGCAVDILIARLNRLEACHKAEAGLSGEQAKEYGQVLYGLCGTNGGPSWNLFNLAHATVEDRQKALKQIGVEQLLIKS